MGSVKVVLQKAYRNKSGQTAVVLQITHNYKTKRKTLFMIDAKYWGDGLVKRTHPDQVKLNQIIRSTLNEFEGRVADLDRSGKEWKVQDVFVEKRKSTTLEDAILGYADMKEKSGKWRVARIVRNVADKIQEYDQGVDLSNITHSWLESFQSWLSAYPTINSVATIGKYMKTLKSVLRHEFADGRFFDQRAINYKPPTYISKKERLTRDEFARWCTVDVPSQLELYRDFFAAMVYLRGMRVGDALQLSYQDYQDGRIMISEQKTDDIQDMHVVKPLASILDKYKDQSEHYLFPILRQQPRDPKIDRRYQKHIESKTTTLNKNYKLIAAYAGIKKKVTNHIARHTFASFADRSGLDSRTISKMLNHSSLKVTEGYLGELRRYDELDDAADKVFG